MNIEDCAGYKKLLLAIEMDEKKSPNFHDYRAKLSWVLERVKHYSEKTKLEEINLLNAWEETRDYWYMNYYQDSNQPLIDNDFVKVVENIDELKALVGNKGYRCPLCRGISKSPYECDSDEIIRSDKKPCDWKSYGLFRTMGKGIFIFVKSNMIGEEIFKPVSLEISEPCPP